MRQTLFAQLAALPQKVEHADSQMPWRLRRLVFRYRMSTLNDVLSEYLTDPRCPRPSGPSGPSGVTAIAMSFLLFNQMLETLHAGSYYALGSFQTLADALVSAVGHMAGTYCSQAE